MTAPLAKDFRAVVVMLMRQTLADEAAHGDWTYEAVRPMPMPPRPWTPGLRVRGDCSKGVQYLSFWAGLTDPMNENFGPYGNSQTLWLRLQHLDHPSELLAGDAVTFGVDGDEHAARVLEPGGDPLLWSFGHQGAPNTYRLSFDQRPAQYLRCPIPVYVPTPDDRLRSRTGWFAWMAWRLGEGDWKPHGKAAPNVRPNVPAAIDESWWERYATFVANRDKGDPTGTTTLAAPAGAAVPPTKEETP